VSGLAAALDEQHLSREWPIGSVQRPWTERCGEVRGKQDLSIAEGAQAREAGVVVAAPVLDPMFERSCSSPRLRLNELEALGHSTPSLSRPLTAAMLT
jgi:hypothetical protein